MPNPARPAARGALLVLSAHARASEASGPVSGALSRVIYRDASSIDRWPGDSDGEGLPGRVALLKIDLYDAPVRLLGGMVAFEALAAAPEKVRRKLSDTVNTLLLIRLRQPSRASLAAVLSTGVRVLGHPGVGVLLVAARTLDFDALYALGDTVDGISLVPASLKMGRSLRDLSYVRYVAQALPPDERRLLVTPTPTLRVLLVPPTKEDSGTALARVIETIHQLGGRILRVRHNQVECSLRRPYARRIARLPEVAAVMERELGTVLMDTVSDAIGVTTTRAARMVMGADDVSVDGEAQTVALVDLGVHQGSGGLPLPDLEGRVSFAPALAVPRATQVRARRVLSVDAAADSAQVVADVGGAQTDASVGHGTHMATIIAGDGSVAANILDLDRARIPRGLAPRANIYLQDVGAWVERRAGARNVFTFGPYLLPDDLGELCQDAADAGASVQNMSLSVAWLTRSEYNQECYDIDRAVMDNPTLCVCVAAGNARYGQSAVTLPGVAKNVLTVGACGSRDALDDNLGTTAPMSCRGPVDGTRIKPDVVAPGVRVLARRSSGLGSPGTIGVSETDITDAPGDPNFERDRPYQSLRGAYSWSGGTSVATAIVSGAVALLRQRLQREHPELVASPPSAALLKALIVLTAVPYGPDGVLDPPPNGERGFGRISLADLLGVEEPRRWFFRDDAALAMQPDQSWSLNVAALDPTRPLVVTLVWTDPPAELPATGLTNRLKLTVQREDDPGIVFVGNDRDEVVDNVQRVWIPNPEGSTWTIHVSGVLTGMLDDGHAGQPWALAVLNALDPEAPQPDLGPPPADPVQQPSPGPKSEVPPLGFEEPPTPAEGPQQAREP